MLISRSCSSFVPWTKGGDARSIPVRITPRSAARGPSEPVNRQRVVKVINPTKITPQKPPNYSFLSFYMANARSVREKLDELTAQLLTVHMDIAIITESWLHDHIDSNILTIPGYNIVRRDRRDRIGGVCVFRDPFQAKIWLGVSWTRVLVVMVTPSSSATPTIRYHMWGGVFFWGPCAGAARPHNVHHRNTRLHKDFLSRLRCSVIKRFQHTGHFRHVS